MESVSFLILLSSIFSIASTQKHCLHSRYRCIQQNLLKSFTFSHGTFLSVPRVFFFLFLTFSRKTFWNCLKDFTFSHGTFLNVLRVFFFLFLTFNNWTFSKNSPSATEASWTFLEFSSSAFSPSAAEPSLHFPFFSAFFSIFLFLLSDFLGFVKLTNMEPELFTNERLLFPAPPM